MHRGERVFLNYADLGFTAEDAEDAGSGKPPRNPDANRIYQRLQAAIDGKGGRFHPIRMRAIETADGKYQILSVSPEPGRDQKAAVDTLGQKFEWSDSLLRAVETDADYRFQQEAMNYFQSLHNPAAENHASSVSQVSATFSQIFARECAALGIDSAAVTAAGIDVALAATGSLDCAEGGRKVRYNVLEAFALQNRHCASPEQQLHALANYCRQQAVVESFARSRAGLVRDRQQLLIGQGSLESTDPTMTRSESEMAGYQMGRVIGALRLCGLNEMIGAEPAHGEHDPIEQERKHPDMSVHFSVKQSLGVAADRLQPAEKLSLYLDKGARELAANTEISAYNVGIEQKRLIKGLTPPKETPEHAADLSALKDVFSTTLQNAQSILSEL